MFMICTDFQYKQVMIASLSYCWIP